MRALTAGPWTPLPTARMADIRYSSQRESYPAMKSRASTSVAAAMAASDAAMSRLRLYRSAHTPANGERNKVGRKPQMMATVIAAPDCVVRVMCQKIAYCTSDVPSRDSV